MRRNGKMLVALIVAFSVFGTTACGMGGSSGSSETPSEDKGGDVSVEIFSTYATEKILQDLEATAEQKLTAEFSIVSARGESEDAQVILRPDKDVKSCTVNLGKITMADGTVFPAENVSLYYQEYIEIKTRTKGYTTNPFGFYPDILVPYENAVACKENKIKGGENQAIVLSAKVAEDQKVGLYSGKATITLDGTVKTVDVKIDVKDVTFPAVKHLDTNFNTDYVLVIDGELNDTLDMYYAYVDKLLEYGVMPRRLPGASASTVDTFKESVRKYYDQISSYEIPADTTSKVSKDLFTTMLTAICEMSLEDGVNYFEKARYWLYCVDEPVQTNRTTLAVEAFDQFHTIANAFADEVELWEVADNGAITKALLADSIRNAKALLTSWYTDLVPNADIWCPTVGSLKNQSSRAYYEEEAENEYWVYTLNTSLAPQPGPHIDNPNGLNADRLLGWMCEDYGISGRLYYETLYQQKISYTGGFHYEKCDPYTEPMRYPDYNGDGFVLYPGAKYGVFGPLASNRLVAVRDSVEDYELLYQLRDKYNKAGYDAESILEVIYDSLYAGVYVSAGGKELFEARNQIFNLHSLADKGVFVTDCVRTADGYSLSVKGGATVKVNGSAVSSNDNINIVASAKSNGLSVEKDGVVFAYTFCGKKQVSVDYNNGKSQGVADNGKYSHAVVNGAEIGVSGNVEKATFNSETKAVYIRPEGISSLLSAKTKEVTIVVYNPTSEDITATFYVEGDVETPNDSCILKPGKNEIVLEGFSMLNWKALQTATGFLVRFSEDTLSTVYFGEIYITQEAE